MSSFEFILRVVIILFGLWAVSTSAMIAYHWWREHRDEN